MRDFSAPFIVQKNLLTGARPAAVLKLIASGTPVYISDRELPFVDPDTSAAVTTKAWVTSWGQVREGLNGNLGEYSVGEFSLDIGLDELDPDNILQLIDTCDIETDPATLFAWFQASETIQAEKLFVGYVKDIKFAKNDASVTLYLQDETLKLQANVGAMVTIDTFPDADPDDIGKLIPVVFGTIEKFPTLAIDAGIKTSLTAGVSATATAISVSDSAGFWVGMWLGIDDETLAVSAINGSSITVVRGVDTTVATVHQRGADVIEIRPNDFVYLIADHPVQSVTKVWGKVGDKLMDITPICTIYTGYLGMEHPDYPGRGCVSVPGFITISQALNLMLNDGIGVSDSLAVTDGISVDDTIAVSDTISITNTIAVSDGIAVSSPTISNPSHLHGTTGAVSQYSTNLPVWTGPTSYSLNFPGEGRGRGAVAYSITLQQQGSITQSSSNRLIIYVNGSAYINDNVNWTGYGYPLYSGRTISYQFNVNAGDVNVDSVVISINWTSSSSTMQVTQASRTITVYDNSGSTTQSSSIGGAVKSGTVTKTGNVTKSGSASKSGGVTKTGAVTRSGSVLKTGTVTLTGNSVANTVIGDAVLVDVVGLSLNTPDQAINYLLTNYGGSCGVVSVIGTFPSEYLLNGAITELNTVIYWINRIAFEFRAFFKFQSGAARLLVRPDNLTSQKTIAISQINNFTRERAAYEDIINVVSLRYSRDYTKAKGLTAYKALSSDKNADSIARYGKCEKDEQFCCNFITSSSVAVSVRDFYLVRYAFRHWLYTLECFLDNLELEFGDQISVDLKPGTVGHIRESGYSPGNNDMDKISIKLEI